MILKGRVEAIFERGGETYLRLKFVSKGKDPTKVTYNHANFLVDPADPSFEAISEGDVVSFEYIYNAIDYEEPLQIVEGSFRTIDDPLKDPSQNSFKVYGEIQHLPKKIKCGRQYEINFYVHTETKDVLDCLYFTNDIDLEIKRGRVALLVVPSLLYIYDQEGKTVEKRNKLNRKYKETRPHIQFHVLNVLDVAPFVEPRVSKVPLDIINVTDHVKEKESTGEDYDKMLGMLSDNSGDNNQDTETDFPPDIREDLKDIQELESVIPEAKELRLKLFSGEITVEKFKVELEKLGDKIIYDEGHEEPETQPKTTHKETKKTKR